MSSWQNVPVVLNNRERNSRASWIIYFFQIEKVLFILHVIATDNNEKDCRVYWGRGWGGGRAEKSPAVFRLDASLPQVSCRLRFLLEWYWSFFTRMVWLIADVNECDELNNRMSLCKNAKCINTEGSYKCVCLPGYVPSDKPNYCTPLNTALNLEKDSDLE